jgi:hypothetical protein
MKNILFLVLFISLIFHNLTGQQKNAHISFKEVDHDFKTIKEENGSVSYVFSFTNIGGSPLLLQEVTASCGCTTPEYTKEPIVPGGTGSVNVTFNPEGRPGQFTKDITVKSNADNAPIVLKIIGTVEAKPMKIEEKFRFAIGDLRFASSQLGFGRMIFGESKSLNMKLTNTGKSPVKLEFYKLPGFLKIKPASLTVKPGEDTNFEVTFNSKIKNDYGFLVDHIIVIVNGKKDTINKIAVTSDIKEDFSKLTEAQKNNAPSINFESPTYDFGYVKEGNTVVYRYKFKNTGKSDLYIRKVSATCSCSIAAPENKILKPGQTGYIKVTLDTKGFKGAQSKQFSVVSNDPLASQVYLTLKGVVRTPVNK